MVFEEYFEFKGMYDQFIMKLVNVSFWFCCQ